MIYKRLFDRQNQVVIGTIEQLACQKTWRQYQLKLQTMKNLAWKAPFYFNLHTINYMYTIRPACIYADMISVKSQSLENFMQDGVIKNMTDLQSKSLVKMNDNCRLQNNLSETKTNTYLPDQSSICQHCTYLYWETKAKNFYNLSVALSHARTTVISTFYTSFNQYSTAIEISELQFHWMHDVWRVLKFLLYVHTRVRQSDRN